MKMKGMLLASLTLLSGAVMLTACSANQRKASDSKTLYLMQTGDILSLDNSNQANLTQWNVLEQSMEGMYRAGKNGKLIPAMATSIVKPTNSGRTYSKFYVGFHFGFEMVEHVLDWRSGGLSQTTVREFFHPLTEPFKLCQVYHCSLSFADGCHDIQGLFRADAAWHTFSTGLNLEKPH